MSNKTIAKFCGFVISASVFGSLLAGCSMQPPTSGRQLAGSPYDPPKVTGKIKSNAITESSGIAASRCQKGILWTHNDSGDDAFLYAFDESGTSLGTWRIPNAQNNDWEDIAAFRDKDGKCFLYIGETGDNKGKWPVHSVYRVKEPTVRPSDQKGERKNPIETEKAEILRFTYPDYLQDAECLMVQPRTGEIYIVTKRITGAAGVYRLKPDPDPQATVTLQKVAEISVPAIPNGLITGGDISPDGRHVILCDYTRAYELTLPDGDVNFDDIWQQDPVQVDIGKREAGEAVSYSMNGTSILATSEGKHSPIFKAESRK